MFLIAVDSPSNYYRHKGEDHNHDCYAQLFIGEERKEENNDEDKCKTGLYYCKFNPRRELVVGNFRLRHDSSHYHHFHYQEVFPPKPHFPYLPPSVPLMSLGSRDVP